jgi:hypothetical protein
MTPRQELLVDVTNYIVANGGSILETIAIIRDGLSLKAQRYADELFGQKFEKFQADVNEALNGKIPDYSDFS